MDYQDIKRIIEEDYTRVQQAKVIKGDRNTMKTFYINFSVALEELHLAVGPFVTSTDELVKLLRYKKENLSKEVYNIIVQYCKDKFNLSI